MNYFDVVTHEQTYTVSQDDLGELMTELQADQVHILDVSKVDSCAHERIADHSGYVVDHAPCWASNP